MCNYVTTNLNQRLSFWIRVKKKQFFLVPFIRIIIVFYRIDFEYHINREFYFKDSLSGQKE
jgi:TRAP-type mannitol/chloroaromatic compound transport system permease small subunit